ncbi:SH3 domain-containing protein [Ruminococcus flavefaciens]|uniref:Glycosyl hydrolases family 11 n=1 Tax=Ruminococcus flavefaciens TaxID=1265 RepID=A0A1M7H142_RUMFL|nr:glycoside hydrolase family 11 protein [Ruminococcus flavefaciens]SHM21869.1 Glycosyl hydrolases family 11 [Ruminococcus flavefaciens]
MRIRTRSFLSAVISAALCIEGVPLQTANADIIIDHNCSGIDKGYYYEIANNDKDSQPEFRVMTNGNYSCSWDNEEEFSAARAMKFASPVEYSKLGAISYKYWKRIDIERLAKDKDAYVRFGVRLHNSNGDVFDIVEVDSSSDNKNITEKQSGYKKIGTLASKEAINDYTIFGPSADEPLDVAYTLYVRENEDKKSNTFLCRRDVPMNVNNDIENERRININDKLDAIAAAGYDLGDITDIGLFLESAYSKGEATIFTYDISIENMPEIAPDEYDDEEAPIIVKDYDYGVRTGYYYGIDSRFTDDKIEVIAPSLFKAEWDSRENKYNCDPYFERGKQYESGQSYKAVSGSSIDYTMNFDVEGSFAVSAAAKLSSLELTDKFQSAELYVVDACSEGWQPSEWSKKIDDFSAEGTEYEVYDGSQGLMGTGKTQVTKRYFFISKDAVKNGKKGTVTAKHDMKPYMEYVYGLGEPLGSPKVIVAQINGYVSKGSAELVKNEITLPEFIKDDGEFERAKRRIDISGFNSDVYVNGLTYGKQDYNMSMKGYAGEKLNCEWNSDSAPIIGSSDYEYGRDFYVGLNNLDEGRGNSVIGNSEDLLIDYSIDIGDVKAIKDDHYWVIGGSITSYNTAALNGNENIDDYTDCNIFIADKWEGEFAFRKPSFNDPKEFGTIESNGVKYDVIVSMPDVKKGNSEYVLLKRQEQPEPVEASDVSDGHKRYTGSIDAADIIKKLNGLGIKTYDIWNAYFVLDVYGNEGSAVINSVDVKGMKNEEITYTNDDLDKLSAFILGKKVDIKEGTDYDVNGDGVWDTYDLCLMRKQLAKNNNEAYVEPDNRCVFGTTYIVNGENVNLYRGPGKNYEAVASIPVEIQLTELGYQNNHDSWFFTQYDGKYGWISLNDAVSPYYAGAQWGKPVIYLYPEEETDVHVELELTTSELYTTYPKYNNGWDVTAYPDGSLLNKADGTHHKYLFWESVNSRTRFDFSKGFCVAGSDTESFLKEKLTYMGLTEEEMNEFIVYWLPKMEHNEYNLITFQGDLYTDAAKLDITPSPDSLLRIFMVYAPLEDAIDIEPQQLDSFERNGFTVVEWGGTEVR